jgi:hypothetical protein
MIIQMAHPSISQYLTSTCLLVIDEFNNEYNNKSKSDLKTIADEGYNEMDITTRIGRPFGSNVRYSVSDQFKNSKINHDVLIASKDFKIEIKYLKNWYNASGLQKSNSMNWEPFQCDFDWLLDEIDSGNKDNRAFVIGWFNCTDHFTSLIKLGAGVGYNPPMNQERACYFPFIMKTRFPTRIHDTEYKYVDAYKELPVTPIGNRKGSYHCMFIGQETDVFHFAIYY